MFLPPDQWSKRYDEAFYTVKIINKKKLDECPSSDIDIDCRGNIPAYYYQVAIYRGPMTYTLWRRYTHFKWLYQKLQSTPPKEPQNPEAEPFRLPPGTPCPFFQRQDDDFADNRKHELEEFLWDVVQRPGYANHPAVVTFLQLISTH